VFVLGCRFVAVLEAGYLKMVIVIFLVFHSVMPDYDKTYY
jgi:hypothetical protein